MVRSVSLRLLLLIVALMLALSVSSCDGGRTGYPDGTILPPSKGPYDDAVARPVDGSGNTATSASGSAKDSSSTSTTKTTKTTTGNTTTH